jgi:hypothetical protein
MTRSAQIIAFPPPKTPAARAAASEDVPASGVAAPFREWLDPNQLRAIHDDRIDMGEYLRSRAVPDTIHDFRLWHLFAEPGLGGTIGMIVLVLACALIAPMCVIAWLS